MEAGLAPFRSDSTEQAKEKVLVCGPKWTQHAVLLLREMWNELGVGHMAASSSEQLKAAPHQMIDSRTKIPMTIFKWWIFNKPVIALIFRE